MVLKIHKESKKNFRKNSFNYVFLFRKYKINGRVKQIWCVNPLESAENKMSCQIVLYINLISLCVAIKKVLMLSAGKNNVSFMQIHKNYCEEGQLFLCLMVFCISFLLLVFGTICDIDMNRLKA